ncbi:alpha/beta fold hydrolase [Sphingomonas changnyeongensis]|uniref:Alpha/beta fold hydrolase n=1 Tax=Sphingomonas changnyeongensis TaxID=2698679 RepID=A0A7Z2NU69_9SPHN|nr:alpha/beta fold hydrolase [Sphingomonas changnyeongensis]QHL89515.1 alpha/beta fold hydrolase [Sphingomonas changnyeongensis]
MSIAPRPIDYGAPGWGMLARELRTVVNPRRLAPPPASLTRQVGAGRPVLVIPGFLASDGSTRPLRVGLGEAGFRAHGWGRGRNLGLRDDVLAAVDARIAQISRGQPVALVGWSLGGLIAREYAKRAPGAVSRVVTLGSPICGDPRRNNNVWRVYEWVAGHPVDAPPLPCALEEKPPVETVAIWSRQDGIVAGHAARGASDRAVEIGCGHIEMVFAPEAIRAVVDALA